jgi:hypothetical protein
MKDKRFKPTGTVNNRYASITRGGGYYAGRYRSDAWFADGGANDEGYNYRHCCNCRDTTEHDLTECLQCGSINN